MKIRTGDLQRNFEIVVNALSQYVTSHKIMNDTRTVATEAILAINPDFISEAKDDKEFLIGYSALNEMKKHPLVPNAARDIANRALSQMLPKWALEFGLKVFEGVPHKLIALLEQLEDLSSRNDDLPRFGFAFKNEVEYWEFFIGHSDNNTFVFELCCNDEDTGYVITNASLIAELGLQLDDVNRPCVQVSEESFEAMCAFIENYCLPDKEELFFKTISLYQIGSDN